MDHKSQKRFNRKRKLENNKEAEFYVSQNKNRHFDKQAQAEEEDLAKDLFGDHTGFLKSLEEAELESGSSKTIDIDVDSGLGETETDSSNDEARTKPAWYDEDDEGIDVGSALNSQGRKLPNGGINKRSNRYSDLLQHKFKSLVGTPKWASLEKKESGGSDDEILKSCGHVIKSKSHFLRPDVLEFKKVNELNQETHNEGPKITAIEFHHSYTVSLVTGISGIASLLAVDGKRNNKLHSIAFDNYAIESAKFINNGNEALLGSNHTYVYSYDLNAAKATKIYLPHGVTHCKRFDVSNAHNILAVCGKWGQIHLISSSSYELIATLKQNSHVTALAFNADESQLFGHGVEGEVTVWDIGSRRVKHKFMDEGCLQGTTISVSSSGQHIATGTAQGVVNIYDVQTVLNSKNPKPNKSVMNLTTGISSVKFNSTSEILGFASNEMTNSVRLLHLASGKVFSNFPPFNTKLGRINTLSFSPNSGYVAFGSMKSTVPLYRLKHYNNY